MGNTTTISRNWTTTIAFLVGALLCFAAAVGLFLWSSSTIVFAFSVVVALFGVFLAYGAISGSSEARCPSCGAPLSGLSAGDNDGVVCEACHSFFEGKGGKLWATEPNRIADTPLFGTVLQPNFQWPQGCCVCGDPTTHEESIHIKVYDKDSAAKNLGLQAATAGFFIQSTAASTTITIGVPHCDAHTGGALLGCDDGKTIRIRFKSYPYLRQFCERNAVQPQ